MTKAMSSVFVYPWLTEENHKYYVHTVVVDCGYVLHMKLFGQKENHLKTPLNIIRPDTFYTCSHPYDHITAICLIN